MSNRNPALKFLINNGMYIVISLLFVYFSVTARGFFSASNLMNIPNQIAFVAIIATGMTLVIITGGIDLSVGSIVALTAVIFSIIIRETQVPVPLAIIISITLGAVGGLINGFFIVKFNVPPFISTLAMMTIARGFARFIAENTKIFIDMKTHPQIEFYNKLVSSYSIVIPVLVLIMLAIVVIVHIALVKTRFGRYVIATGGNEEAARLSGINVGQIKMIVYTLNAALAAVVGIMMACKFTNGNPEFGVMWELDAIAACVVGGTSLMGGKGNILKTLFGALLIGILDNGLNIKALSSEMIYIVKGAIILGAVLIDQIKE